MKLGDDRGVVDGPVSEKAPKICKTPLREKPVMAFVKKHSWIVLVTLFAVLIAVGIATS